MSATLEAPAAARLAHELGADVIELNVLKHGKADGEILRKYPG
jgi:hypothetical protein